MKLDLKPAESIGRFRTTFLPAAKRLTPRDSWRNGGHLGDSPFLGARHISPDSSFEIVNPQNFQNEKTTTLSNLQVQG
jgi:hypothetical protein